MTRVPEKLMCSVWIIKMFLTVNQTFTLIHVSVCMSTKWASCAETFLSRYSSIHMNVLSCELIFPIILGTSECTLCCSFINWVFKGAICEKCWSLSFVQNWHSGIVGRVGCHPEASFDLIWPETELIQIWLNLGFVMSLLSCGACNSSALDKARLAALHVSIF